VSWPRNLFPLVDEAERHWMIAGGIGITPFMAMIAELKRRRADFHLHYCSRAPERTAFREDLSLLAALGRVSFHYDGGDPAKGLDVAALLKEPPPGTHLYYCGPVGLMDAVARAATHWPPRTVHCEYFKGPAAAIPEMIGEDLPFRVRLARRGGEYEVRADETIAMAMRRHGVKVDTSCELGYCGTCLTRYLSGEPDFRDQILQPADRQKYVLTCCTRAKGEEPLELDL
jgi:ferredoxin-NADP reductase